jgi:hypothetical protein
VTPLSHRLEADPLRPRSRSGGAHHDRSLTDRCGGEQVGSIRASILAFVNSLPASVLPTRGDLILGFATGYKPHMIAPFVESVRTHGQFVGKIALFVDPAARKMADYLMAHDIEAIAFDQSKSPAAHFNLARSFGYFEYLREQWNSGAVFNQILLTDVRDVIFQKPLFGTPCTELEFHLEEPSFTIGQDWFTARGLEMAFGKQAVRDLSSKTVSCGGAVSGRAIGIFNYLAQKQLLALGLSTAARSIWGIDQSLHNYILHTGLTRAAVSKPNFVRVATLGVAQGSNFTCDPEGRVINPNGEISEIAHQWDRHRHLTKTICVAYLRNTRYGRWRFQMARTLPRFTLSTWSLLLGWVKLFLIGRYNRTR